MRALRRFLARLAHTVWPDRGEQDLSREISSHLALRSFIWLDDFRRDLQHAARSLRRAPGFAAVAILTLALGIGANTAIFSVVNALLLRPLPYDRADRLVRIVQRPASDAPPGGAPRPAIELGELDTIRSATRTFSHIAVHSAAATTLTGAGDATRLSGVSVSAAMLPLLGVPPQLGRWFEARDEPTGGQAVAILSHTSWQRYFNGDPHVVGRTVEFDGRPLVVIGVMPRGFQFLDLHELQAEFWIPLVLPATGPMLRARFNVTARVKADVPLAAAADEMSALLGELRGTAANGQTTAVDLVPLQDQWVAPIRPALRVLSGAVAIVLLIACVNVANLLLARMSARRRELAVRLALGAGRGRLVRQALTESLVLAAGGGAAGIVVAWGGVQLLKQLGASIPRLDLQGVGGIVIPRLDEIHIDLTALAFTVTVSIVAALIVGLAPALSHTRVETVEGLRDGSSAHPGGFNTLRRHRLQSLLVVAEVAMALMLCVGGLLLVRSFLTLANVPPGYVSDQVLTFRLSLPSSINPANQLAAVEDLVQRLERLFGARSVGYSQSLPMVRLLREIRLRTTAEPAPPLPPRPPGAPSPPEVPNFRVVSRDFLTVMRTEIVAGRGFEETDQQGRPGVMLINRALARSGFFADNPIGKQIYGFGKAPWEIVGVVDDVRQFGLEREAGYQVFVDFRQMPPGPIGDVTYFVVRTSRRASVMSSIRAVVREVDSRAAVDGVAMMDELVSNSMVRPRFYAALLSTFAGIAVLLAMIGVYGLVAYAVTQRTREIGIRMAVGAARGDVLRLVLRQGALLTAAGIVAGLLGAVVVTRFLSALLFGLTPLDPATFALASTAFASVAVIAILVPANRATRVDPIAALRSE